MDKKLKFNEKGKFRILLLGDLHESCRLDTDLDKAQFSDMQRLMTTSLDRLQPDLVVFMGDTFISETPTPKEALDIIAKPIKDRGLPFAAVLGNHEHDLKDIAPTLSAYFNHPSSLCRNDNSKISGDMNYNLLIHGKDGQPKFNLWFIDSNNLCQSNVSVYDWVKDDQIQWYESKANELAQANGGKPLPAVLFQHIPVPEEYEALREAKPHEFYQSVRGHGVHRGKRYMLADGAEGYLGEGPATPCYNNGQFQSWKKTDDIIGAFFGHDHLNDFTCTVDGIMMGQCKTSGFRCYTDGCRSCVRIIDIDESEPTKLETAVIHFKQFGLKSKSLGPIKRNLNDKQSIALTAARNALLGAAAIGVAGYAAKKLIEKQTKDKQK